MSQDHNKSIHIEINLQYTLKKYNIQNIRKSKRHY